MKVFLLIWGLATLLPVQGERILEARSYAAPMVGFYELPSELEGVIEKGKGLDPGRAPKLESASFQSRFVREKDELRNLTAWGRKMMLIEDQGDLMVWNEARERLVVWTDDRGHREVARHFAEFLEFSSAIRIEVNVDGELKGEVRGTLEGEFVDENGKLSGMMKGDVFDEALWAGELLFRSQIPEAEFEVKCPCLGVVGSPLVMDLGVLESGKAVTLKLSVEVFLDDKTPIQKWAVRVDGSSPWWEGVLARELGPWEEPEKDRRNRVRRRVEVPRFFREELLGEEVNPFAGKGSPKSFLRNNGVTFREGDWAIFHREPEVLEVAVAPEELMLVEGVFGHCNPGFFGLIELELIQVGADGVVLKKIGLALSEGGQGKVRLAEGFELQVEAAFGWGYSTVECRVAVTGDNGFETQFTVGAGKQLVVQETFDGEWRKWMMSVRVIGREDFRVGDDLDRPGEEGR